jgi:single-strand DNA-binding protein
VGVCPTRPFSGLVLFKSATSLVAYWCKQCHNFAQPPRIYNLLCRRLRRSFWLLKAVAKNWHQRTMEVHLMNNTITLIGRVGQTPTERIYSDTGNRVVKFSIAVKEYSANSAENKTLWFDVDAWNNLGERVAQLVTKGREVVVHGRLSLSTYQKDVNGQKIQMTKPFIKLTSFHLCGAKPTATGETVSEDTDSDTPPQRMLTAVNA